MSDATKTFWMDAIKIVGFPIVACVGFAWFSYKTIEWEREQFVTALNRNAEAMQAVKMTLDELVKSERAWRAEGGGN